MVLRLPIWAVFTVALALVASASCSFDAGRCDDLRASARGTVNQLSRGCLDSSECRPIAMTCGEWAAVRTDADTRPVTAEFLRAEALCGCGDAGAPALTVSPPTLCLAGMCRVAAPPPEIPAECTPIREALVAEIDVENRCAQDSDCTALNVLTCPPVCGQPTAVGADTSRLTRLLEQYDATGGCRACGPTCEGHARPTLKCVLGGPLVGKCVVATDGGASDGGTSDGGLLDGGARVCTGRFADARSGWTVTWAIPAQDGGTARTMLVRSDGIVAVSPPGVQEQATAEELAGIVTLADTAKLLCLDSSFHAGGDATVNVEITATVTGVGLVALRYSLSDTQPPGLPALEAALRALARRIAP